MKNYNLLPIVLIVMLATLMRVQAQDPTRFADDVQAYNQAHHSLKERPIVFVGSSSILKWEDVGDRYTDYPILNRGFGGSQMSDLLYYLEDLVIRYNPKQVFIYEGDNDIASGKSREQILSDTKEVVGGILKAIPDVNIILIAAKPSVKRWDMANTYLEVNQSFATYAESERAVQYADIWNPALGSNGKVLDDIFLDDDLHMNAKGYDIWEEVLRPFLID